MSNYGEYNGDTEHDMWVDYTTDMYEDTDYSGKNPDYDVEWDAECDANLDGFADTSSHYHHHSSPGVFKPQHDSNAIMSAQQYEHRIHHLEKMLAAAIASVAILDTKSANASSAKNVRKYQRRASEKQSEVKRYQEELDKLKAEYKSVKIKSETSRTRVILVICSFISLMAILTALLY